jgi:hypothetical protein
VKTDIYWKEEAVTDRVETVEGGMKRIVTVVESWSGSIGFQEMRLR